MARNPTWTRDELILALDLYRRKGHRGPEHAEVLALSAFLRTAPVVTPADRVTFRNASGVAMKLGNFAALDPAVPGAGLSRGGAGDADVWDKFWADPARLAATAAAIRIAASSATEDALPPADGEDESPEGRLLYRLHVRRERNRRLVTKKKTEALAAFGRLACEVCGFDFALTYGSDGAGVIEAHHRVPLAVAGQSVTRLKDLALVCSNCHAMLHHRKNRSVEELRASVAATK